MSQTHTDLNHHLIFGAKDRQFSGTGSAGDSPMHQTQSQESGRWEPALQSWTHFNGWQSPRGGPARPDRFRLLPD